MTAEVTGVRGSSFDLWPGLICIWIHRPKGGYGFAFRLPVKVLKLFPSRARIEVRTKSGARVERLVSRVSLVGGTLEERRAHASVG